MTAFDWHAQTVWITGASSGLGRALALVTAARGARVFAVANARPGLEQLSARAAADGLQLVVDECDVTDAAAMRAAIERAEAAAPIDIAILNAGILIPQDALHFDPEVFRRVFGVNVQGVVNSVAPLLPRMIARRSGRLVFISSVTAEQPSPGIAAYGASKAAVSHFAAALRFELAEHGVAVQIAIPGWIDTPLLHQMPLAERFRQFWMSPQSAAERIVQGIERGEDEVRMPRGMGLAVRLLRALPSRINARVIAALSRPPA